MRKFSIRFIPLFIFSSSLLIIESCGPTPEELRDEWYIYSQGELKNRLTQIMTTIDSNNEYIYKEYPVYSFTESAGYASCAGSLVYKKNGNGEASLRCSVGGGVTRDGSWKIQWAPATKGTPNNSDIIFNIRENTGTFSKHIGSSNNHWTPIDKFLNNHYNKTDAQKMMTFGDSLRNAFMDERGLTLGSDGRFKKK
jgi:hypothetical protein